MTTTIIGVDFSGAEKTNSLWVTQAILDGDCLTIEKCFHPSSKRATAHQRLEKQLRDLPSDAVVAMDFPFGVPSVFAEYLSRDAKPKTMRDVWRTVSTMSVNDFTDKRNEFVQSPGVEPTRLGDARYFPESFSPLHEVRPNMIPMTFYGMQMLHTLWAETGCHVPPLDCAGHNGPVLLEVMPGAALKARCLPHKEYKNNKGGNPCRNLEKRQKILMDRNLQGKFGIALPNLQDYRDLFIFNDDALDSFIASIVAAAWARNPDQFRHPQPDELPNAKLEGWLYAPKPQSDQS